MGFGIISLLVRSFCEVVIVGQLDRWPTHFQDIIRARDVTYGLFSAGFAILAALSIFSTSMPQDPLLEEERTAIEEVRNWVATRHAAVSGNGRKTVPPFEDLIQPLETKTRNLAVQHGTPSARMKRMKLKEIKSLKRSYVGCEPIVKPSGGGPLRCIPAVKRGGVFVASGSNGVWQAREQETARVKRPSIFANLLLGKPKDQQECPQRPAGRSNLSPDDLGLGKAY